jgi:hypothetical protein
MTSTTTKPQATCLTTTQYTTVVETIETQHSTVEVSITTTRLGSQTITITQSLVTASTLFVTHYPDPATFEPTFTEPV